MAAAAAAPVASRVLLGFFALQIGVVVLLQKIAVPGVGVDLTLPLMSGGLLAMLVFARAEVSPIRLGLYAVMVLLTLWSQLLAGVAVNWPSVLLLYLLFFSTIYRLEVSWPTYYKAMNIYQNLLVFGCAVVLLQDAWQFTLGWSSFPNMDRLLPAELRTQGYVYLQPLNYGSPYSKPNGFFFREASFVSQFAAIALVIELALFRRLWRMALYGVTLFACFAGTGLLILAIISPLLLLRLSGRMIVAAILGALVAVGLAIGTGWWESVAYRFNEVNQANSSTNGRFFYPLQILSGYLSQQPRLLSGLGSGNMPNEISYIWLPITKLVLEYGPVSAIVFHLMFVYALVDRAPSLRIAAVLFVIFSLGGGYLQVAVVVNLCILLGALLRPVGERPTAAQWLAARRPAPRLGAAATAA